MAAWREEGAIPWGGAGVRVGPVGGRLVTAGESGCEPGFPAGPAWPIFRRGTKGARGRGWMEKLALAPPAPAVLTTTLVLTKSFSVSPQPLLPQETKRRSGRSHSSLLWSSARLGLLYHSPTLLRAALVSPPFLVHILLILPDALMLCSSQGHSGVPVLPPSLASKTLLLPFPHQDFSSPLPTPQPWA